MRHSPSIFSNPSIKQTYEAVGRRKHFAPTMPYFIWILKKDIVSGKNVFMYHWTASCVCLIIKLMDDLEKRNSKGAYTSSSPRKKKTIEECFSASKLHFVAKNNLCVLSPAYFPFLFPFARLEFVQWSSSRRSFAKMLWRTSPKQSRDNRRQQVTVLRAEMRAVIRFNSRRNWFIARPWRGETTALLLFFFFCTNSEDRFWPLQAENSRNSISPVLAIPG